MTTDLEVKATQVPVDPAQDPCPVMQGKLSVEDKASFFARLETRLAPSDVTRVRGAYYLAKHGHRSQVRQEKDAEGQPLRYFEHVRRVAIIMMDVAHCYDPDLVITCLLHDTMEDTEDIDGPVIEQFFGKEVARRVRLLTKDPKAPKEAYTDRLWHADRETILCKACDRLDNLRSLGSTSKEFQDRQIKETIQKYRPIFMTMLGSSPVTRAIDTILAQHGIESTP